MVDADIHSIYRMLDPSGGPTRFKDRASSVFPENQGRLQSIVFQDPPGAPVRGLNVYLYRIDLSDASHPEAPARIGGDPRRTVNTLAVDFGPVVGHLDYDGDGSSDQAVVLTEGSIGSVAPNRATTDGESVIFDFLTPVRPGLLPHCGGSSFFVCLASRYPPAWRSGAWVEFRDNSSKPLWAYVPDYPR
jgi:hypothetical protein